MNASDLARLFDHTLLAAAATRGQFRQLCQESREYGFAMVAVNTSAVTICKEFLCGSDVHVGAAIGFPLGQTNLATKIYETKEAIALGAEEIDYVINIRELKEGNLEYVHEEMSAIVDVCRLVGVISKVILENCYLTNEEIRLVCQVARSVKPDFVKTSTGFGTYGAKVEDVALMKQEVGDFVKVKAAGGIRNLASALAMVEAGAERIGTSASVSIMQQYLAELNPDR